MSKLNAKEAVMLYFLNENFWAQPGLVVLFAVSLLTVIFGRYISVSIMYKLILDKISTTFRNSFSQNSVQMKREIKWSFISSLIFTALTSLCFLAYQKGFTKIYTHVYEYSLLYFFLSPLLILALYETYYYWLHRWMHRPAIFRIVHKVHHDSLTPTVFTAFAFHPLEAFAQFLFFPVVIAVIPLHPIMLGLIFMVFTISAMINHAGVEVYSAQLRKHIIGANHHDLHHREFRTNFGLNFTWWDRIMKTESGKTRK